LESPPRRAGCAFVFNLKPPKLPWRKLRARSMPLLAMVLIVLSAACARSIASAPAMAGDRQAFDAFLKERRPRAAVFGEFVALLKKHGVHDVVPAWQLWRQGTDWKACDQPAFAQPKKALWPNVIPTLKLIKRDLVPKVGPVSVVSGFRTAKFNTCAGGASKSRHLRFDAVDVVPRSGLRRSELHKTLHHIWRGSKKAKLGLGLYSGTRFHLDTWRYRRW